MRKLLSYIPLLALISIIGCATTAGDKSKEAYIDKKNAKQHYTNGVDYSTQGKFKEAKKEFKKALKVDPFGSAKRDLNVIEDVLDQKIKNETAIHLFKGIAFYTNKQWDKSIGELNKAVEFNPKYAYAYSLRGHAYLNNTKYHLDNHDYRKATPTHKKAIADFNKAIEIDPKSAYAYIKRGNAYDLKEEYNKAIADFNKAIEIDAKSAYVYNMRGRAYNLTGQHDKAFSDYSKAIEIYPKDDYAYRKRGLIYYYKGQYEKAISDFNKSVEINPKDDHVYRMRGKAYFKWAKKDLACDDFLKVCELGDCYEFDLAKKNGHCVNPDPREIITAAKDGDISKVKKLLAKGVNVNIVDKSTGYTALMYASEEGHADVVKILIDKGADVNVKQVDGQTALMWASFEGHVDVVKMLIDKGADIKARDNDLNTALDHAENEGRHEIVQLLKNVSEKE